MDATIVTLGAVTPRQSSAEGPRPDGDSGDASAFAAALAGAGRQVAPDQSDRDGARDEGAAKSPDSEMVGEKRKNDPASDGANAAPWFPAPLQQASRLAGLTSLAPGLTGGLSSGLSSAAPSDSAAILDPVLTSPVAADPLDQGTPALEGAFVSSAAGPAMNSVGPLPASSFAGEQAASMADEPDGAPLLVSSAPPPQSLAGGVLASTAMATSDGAAQGAPAPPAASPLAATSPAVAKLRTAETKALIGEGELEAPAETARDGALGVTPPPTNTPTADKTGAPSLKSTDAAGPAAADAPSAQGPIAVGPSPADALAGLEGEPGRAAEDIRSAPSGQEARGPAAGRADVSGPAQNTTQGPISAFPAMQATVEGVTADATADSPSSTIAAGSVVEAASELHSPSPRLNEATAAPRPPAHMQVGEQIVRKLERGGVSFEMRLDPPELGQVQIKLEVSGDGGVKAHVGAETPAALAELVRNARELERALTASGLRLEDQGLTFDLNDRPQGRDQPDRDRGGGRQDRREGEEIAVPPVRARSLTAARIDVLA